MTGKIIRPTFGKGRPPGSTTTGKTETGKLSPQAQYVTHLIYGNPATTEAARFLKDLYGERAVVTPFDGLKENSKIGFVKGYSLLMHFPDTKKTFMVGLAEGSRFAAIQDMGDTIGFSLGVYASHMVKLSAARQWRAENELALAKVQKAHGITHRPPEFQPAEKPTIWLYMPLEQTSGYVTKVFEHAESLAEKAAALATSDRPMDAYPPSKPEAALNAPRRFAVTNVADGSRVALTAGSKPERTTARI